MRRIIGLWLISATVAGAFAQTQGETVRVATRLITPFVIEEKGNLTGFSIELWSEIARQINVKTEYIVKPTVRELLAGIDAQDAELGIAAVSITAERELKWDFSQPMFEAGLQILVSAQAIESSLLGNLVAGIFTWDFLLMIGLVIALIAIPAHIIWFLERRPSGNLLTHRSYIPGIFEAAWWTGATLGAQADQMPKSALARLAALIWMFTSIVLIAYFTASVTSNLTLQQLRGDIKGPEDLPGKKVASVKGSTSVEYLRQHNAEVIEFDKVEEAYQALHQGEVNAVVYDAPVLLYYASHEGKGKVQTVGAIFRKENYGIAFPANSPRRKPVNEALLKLKENGTYERLYSKWFGGAR
ncbi:MAG: transporter substrate-binding domain-containing protein [Deltaproteobacteria bacterium]|nr:transporter substrate-binding domain-containing protein [Deltaproteobacteria bacterium]